jgi:hypothetical protein
MALSITHSYVSAVPDAGDASLVQPSDWNDTHDISGLGTGVEAALAVNLGSAGAVLISTSTIPLTIGSSTIASGTDTRILYNNAGVLGQYTLTGTGTVVAMQTAPTFVTSITTPVVRGGDGSTAAPTYSFTSDTNTGLYYNSTFVATNWSGNGTYGGVFDGGGIYVSSTNVFGWQEGGDGTLGDVKLYRDAAATLALRNSTTAQTFRVYDTFTDVSNYRYGAINWSGGVLYIGEWDAGSGDPANLSFVVGSAARWGIAASGSAFYPETNNSYDIGISGFSVPRTGYFGTSVVTPIATITQGTITDPAPQINGTVTWNDAADTFTAWKLDVTNTNSATHSLLLDLQIGSSSIAAVRKDGGLFLNTGAYATHSGPGVHAPTGSSLMAGAGNGGIYLGNTSNLGASCRIDDSKLAVKAAMPIGWAEDATSYGTMDVLLYRDAANTLALRNSTNAQTFRVYNTEDTSLTNYERVDMAWDSNTFKIRTAKGGTGTGRGITIEAVDSTLINLISGRVAVSSGRITMGGGEDVSLDRTAAGNLKLTSDGGTTYGQWTASTSITPRKSELTIATGAITVTGGYHDVDTEADAASDDLDTISGGADGMRLVLRANNSGRTVVVKDGTGNIQCAGDMSLDNIQDTIELIYDGVQTAWLEVGRSDNGA